MTTPEQPQLSPDGQWQWNGTQWVPAAGSAQPANPLPAPSGYPGYAPPPPSGQDGLAITSLITGLFWVFGVSSLVAVITGHLSRGKAKKEGRSPSGLALAGLILGYLGLAGAAVIAVFALAVGGAVVSAVRQHDAAVKSEVTRVATLEATYMVDNDTPTEDLTELGYSSSSPVEISITTGSATINGSDTSWCVAGQQDLTFWYYSSDSGLSRTPC